MLPQKRPPDLSEISTAMQEYASYQISRLRTSEQTRRYAIGGVCVAVALAVFGGGGSGGDKTRIEQVLAADSKTSDGARTVAEVVARMRAIDTGGCPRDFASAYLNHIHAWEKLGSVERQLAAYDSRYNSGSAFLEAFFRGMVFDFEMSKESSAVRREIQTAYNTASLEVKTSFQHVEQVALSYGVRPKKPTSR
ncbi:hypothetical protein [Aquisphaera insulae]|uniref:hypothetical protein n=1 Tax=Aquisphaera insulae TaxID=2712864 RepID=UPI0013EB84C4|nr:hypothetical protein [Aquisphaera insulae]